MATISAGLKVTLQIVNNSYLLITKTQIFQILHFTCRVLQGSILGPLLFLIYVNDLSNASNILDPIMFADDTNLFFSHRNISTLSLTVNSELHKLENGLRQVDCR